MFNAYRVAITSPSELEVLVHSEEAWIPNLHHLWLQLKSEEIAITSEAIARLAGGRSEALTPSIYLSTP